MKLNSAAVYEQMTIFTPRASMHNRKQCFFFFVSRGSQSRFILLISYFVLFPSHFTSERSRNLLVVLLIFFYFKTLQRQTSRGNCFCKIICKVSISLMVEQSTHRIDISTNNPFNRTINLRISTVHAIEVTSGAFLRYSLTRMFHARKSQSDETFEMIYQGFRFQR